MWVNIKLSLLCVLVISLKFANGLDLDCDFKIYTVDGYNCKISNLRIDNDGTEISKLNGNHYYGKNNWNVDVLYIPSTNCIRYLPINIGEYFTSLKKVEISEACLKYVSQNVFVGLNSLETVDIRRNLLPSFPGDTFNNLIHLHTLMLSDNRIEKLETRTFEKLTSLKKLWLSGNFLEILQENLFAKNFFIEEVYLSNNRLKIIDSGVLNHLKHLKVISLDGNFCTSRSFPKDSSIDNLGEEFSVKCTNDTEIVKSSSYAEMMHELFELRKNVNASAERTNQLAENFNNSLTTIDRLKLERKLMIESYRANQTVFHDRNQDLQFRLSNAYKTISNLKESFDDLQENCLKIEEKFNEMMNERIGTETLPHEETTEILEMSESFNVSVKTAFATTLFVFLLLLIISVVIVFMRRKVGNNAKSPLSSETEMKIKEINKNDF